MRLPCSVNISLHCFLAAAGNFKNQVNDRGPGIPAVSISLYSVKL